MKRVRCSRDVARRHGAALIVAATVAVFVARRRADYRPIAWFLAAQTIGNFVRFALVALVLAPARERLRAAGIDPALVPFTGARASLSPCTSTARRSSCGPRGSRP